MVRQRFDGQASHAYKTLRHWILSGNLAPGSRINVRESIAELGTSNGPVRDALIQLRSEHLVQGGHGQNWTVTRVTREMIDEGMIVREGLEAQSARCCAVSATPMGIQRLMKLAEELDGRVEAGLDADDLTTELDERFHLMVAETAGCGWLREEIKRWTVVMTWAGRFIGNLKTKGESHVEVVRAIATGDPDAAGRQMRQHILHPWQEMKWEVHETATPKSAVG